MRLTILFALLVTSLSVIGQNKKVLDHPDFDIWNTIENESINADGSATVADNLRTDCVRRGVVCR